MNPIPIILIVGTLCLTAYMWYRQQNKKREKLMSKKKLEEKEMKEALEMFEKELSAELDKIALLDNPFEALMKLGKEPELDPVKDFNHPSMMKKPEDEEWQ